MADKKTAIQEENAAATEENVAVTEEIAAADEAAASAKVELTPAQKKALGRAQKRERIKAIRAERDTTQAEAIEMAQFQEDVRIQRIITGRITTIEETSAGSCVVVMPDDKHKVYIPMKEFFRTNPIDMSEIDINTAEGKRSLRKANEELLSKILEMDISFILTAVEYDADTKTYYLGGSRLKACDRFAKINFLPNAAGIRRYEEGSLITGQIIGVGTSNMYVCVGGVDVKMKIGQVTYRYIPNLENVYAAGDKINLKIVKIILDESGKNVVDLKVSGTQAESEEAKKKTHLIREGSVAIATLSVVLPQPDGKPKFFGWIDAPVNIPCQFISMPDSAYSFEPKAGDRLKVRIVEYWANGICAVRGHSIVQQRTNKNLYYPSR